MRKATNIYQGIARAGTLVAKKLSLIFTQKQGNTSEVPNQIQCNVPLLVESEYLKKDSQTIPSSQPALWVLISFDDLQVKEFSNLHSTKLKLDFNLKKTDHIGMKVGGKQDDTSSSTLISHISNQIRLLDQPGEIALSDGCPADGRVGDVCMREEDIHPERCDETRETVTTCRKPEQQKHDNDEDIAKVTTSTIRHDLEEDSEIPDSPDDDNNINEEIQEKVSMIEKLKESDVGIQENESLIEHLDGSLKLGKEASEKLLTNMEKSTTEPDCKSKESERAQEDMTTSAATSTTKMLPADLDLDFLHLTPSINDKEHLTIKNQVTSADESLKTMHIPENIEQVPHDQPSLATLESNFVPVEKTIVNLSEEGPAHLRFKHATQVKPNEEDNACVDDVNDNALESATHFGEEKVVKVPVQQEQNDEGKHIFQDPSLGQDDGVTNSKDEKPFPHLQPEEPHTKSDKATSNREKSPAALDPTCAGCSSGEEHDACHKHVIPSDITEPSEKSNQTGEDSVSTGPKNKKSTSFDEKNLEPESPDGVGGHTEDDSGYFSNNQLNVRPAVSLLAKTLRHPVNPSDDDLCVNEDSAELNEVEIPQLEAPSPEMPSYIGGDLHTCSDTGSKGNTRPSPDGKGYEANYFISSVSYNSCQTKLDQHPHSKITENDCGRSQPGEQQNDDNKQQSTVLNDGVSTRTRHHQGATNSNDFESNSAGDRGQQAKLGEPGNPQDNNHPQKPFTIIAKKKTVTTVDVCLVQHTQTGRQENPEETLFYSYETTLTTKEEFPNQVITSDSVLLESMADKNMLQAPFRNWENGTQIQQTAGRIQSVGEAKTTTNRRIVLWNEMPISDGENKSVRTTISSPTTPWLKEAKLECKTKVGQLMMGTLAGQQCYKVTECTRPWDAGNNSEELPLVQMPLNSSVVAADDDHSSNYIQEQQTYEELPTITDSHQEQIPSQRCNLQLDRSGDNNEATQANETDLLLEGKTSAFSSLPDLRSTTKNQSFLPKSFPPLSDKTVTKMEQKSAPSNTWEVCSEESNEEPGSDQSASTRAIDAITSSTVTLPNYKMISQEHPDDAEANEIMVPSGHEGACGIVNKSPITPSPKPAMDSTFSVVEATEIRGSSGEGACGITNESPAMRSPEPAIDSTTSTAHATEIAGSSHESACGIDKESPAMPDPKLLMDSKISMVAATEIRGTSSEDACGIVNESPGMSSPKPARDITTSMPEAIKITGSSDEDGCGIVHESPAMPILKPVTDSTTSMDTATEITRSTYGGACGIVNESPAVSSSPNPVIDSTTSLVEATEITGSSDEGACRIMDELPAMPYLKPAMDSTTSMADNTEITRSSDPEHACGIVNESPALPFPKSAMDSTTSMAETTEIRGLFGEDVCEIVNESPAKLSPKPATDSTTSMADATGVTRSSDESTCGIVNESPAIPSPKSAIDSTTLVARDIEIIESYVHESACGIINESPAMPSLKPSMDSITSQADVLGQSIKTNRATHMNRRADCISQEVSVESFVKISCQSSHHKPLIRKAALDTSSNMVARGIRKDNSDSHDKIRQIQCKHGRQENTDKPQQEAAKKTQRKPVEHESADENKLCGGGKRLHRKIGRNKSDDENKTYIGEGNLGEHESTDTLQRGGSRKTQSKFGEENTVNRGKGVRKVTKESIEELGSGDKNKSEGGGRMKVETTFGECDSENEKQPQRGGQKMWKRQGEYKSEDEIQLFTKGRKGKETQGEYESSVGKEPHKGANNEKQRNPGECETTDKMNHHNKGGPNKKKKKHVGSDGADVKNPTRGGKKLGKKHKECECDDENDSYGAGTERMKESLWECKSDEKKKQATARRKTKKIIEDCKSEDEEKREIRKKNEECESDDENMSHGGVRRISQIKLAKGQGANENEQNENTQGKTQRKSGSVAEIRPHGKEGRKKELLEDLESEDNKETNRRGRNIRNKYEECEKDNENKLQREPKRKSGEDETTPFQGARKNIIPKTNNQNDIRSSKNDAKIFQHLPNLPEQSKHWTNDVVCLFVKSLLRDLNYFSDQHCFPSRPSVIHIV